MEITLSKLIALGLVLVYTIVGVVMSGPAAIGGLAMLLMPPLALIWFSDVLSEMTGYVGKGGHIDQSSPEFLVAGFGWVILIGLPIYAIFYSG